MIADLMDVKSLAQRYRDVFATKDPAVIVGLHSPDTVFALHTGQPERTGRDDVRTAYAELFATWPDFDFEVRRELIGANFWILDWVMHVTAGAKPARLDCMDVVTLDNDGLVQRKDTFVDLAQALHLRAATA